MKSNSEEDARQISVTNIGFKPNELCCPPSAKSSISRAELALDVLLTEVAPVLPIMPEAAILELQTRWRDQCFRLRKCQDTADARTRLLSELSTVASLPNFSGFWIYVRPGFSCAEIRGNYQLSGSRRKTIVVWKCGEGYYYDTTDSLDPWITGSSSTFVKDWPY